MDASVSADRAKQLAYRDARFTKAYDGIWQSVGKCVYCDLNPKYVFYEDNGVVMTVNLYAYIDGHMLIVPRRHVRSPKDLTASEWDTVRKCFYLAKRLMGEVHGAKGIQLIQKDGSDAQSTVTDHLHFQAIPFDAPDLCVWNYRRLKFTPLENAELYRQADKKIAKYDQRFTDKYAHATKLAVFCDALILNTKGEVLFEERSLGAELPRGLLTPPGGHIDNLESTLEQELAREVREETGLDVDPTRFTLLASRLDTLPRYRYLSSTRYIYNDRFLLNTYKLTGIKAHTALRPGDDARKLSWLHLTEAQNHPRVSDEIKRALRLLEPSQ